MEKSVGDGLKKKEGMRMAKDADGDIGDSVMESRRGGSTLISVFPEKQVLTRSTCDSF